MEDKNNAVVAIVEAIATTLIVVVCTPMGWIGMFILGCFIRMIQN